MTLALKLDRPLFLEGEAGVGKTEIAKVLAASLGRNLIRLQCYEGLDAHSAMYEWNYQRQLLAIARALVYNPAVLVLDEATSSVDPESEALIRQAMTALLAGRTSLTIAHRLSTLHDVDRIVVLENGRLVEDGRHEELLNRGGVYAGLYEAQFQT